MENTAIVLLIVGIVGIVLIGIGCLIKKGLFLISDICDKLGIKCNDFLYWWGIGYDDEREE